MITVNRAGWNARSPRSTTPLNRSRIQLFVTHYSGGPRLQTVRSIQNWCMDGKGHRDVDYNDLVRGRTRYVGRGWNVGGHTLNHNSISYGVCVIGRDGDVTDEDEQTVREIYDEVCRTLGRALTKTDHRTVLGRNHTDCPGDELHGWVARGMPYTLGGSVGDTFAKIGDESEAVGLLQRRVVRAGGDVGVWPADHPRAGEPLIDNDYGGKTAAGLAGLIGGDGKTYGALEVDLLDEILRERTVDRLVPDQPDDITLVIPETRVTARLEP